MRLRWQKTGLSIVIAYMTASSFGVRTRAQSSEHPYRVMDKGQVSFEGPDRGTESDIAGMTIRIGLLLPLEGPRAEQGKLLLDAAQITVDQANVEIPARGGRASYALAVRNESEQWGRASNAIVELILQEQVVALVTSVDGKIAHQAEQIVNKLGAPVLTLSSDPTTTEINIPWIFRVVPSDTDQAKAIVSSIYRDEKPHRVLLIAEGDYDGQMGADEFVRAVSSAGKAPPGRLEVDERNVSAEDLALKIDRSQADVVVVWSGPRVGREAVSAVSKQKTTLTLYLAGKATEFLTEKAAGVPILGRALENDGFSKAYQQKTGAEPVLAARQMNLAVQSVIDATRVVGANRARTRDYLASGVGIGVATEEASFDPAGNLVRGTPPSSY